MNKIGKRNRTDNEPNQNPNESARSRTRVSRDINGDDSQDSLHDNEFHPDVAASSQADLLEALISGRERFCAGSTISESPESQQSFGLAEDGDAAGSGCPRFAKLNKENAKMRRILDRVQELVEASVI